MRLNIVDRRWNWIDDGVLAYMLAALRAVWVWTLVHLASRALAPNRADLMTSLTVFALLALSTLASQSAFFRVKNSIWAFLLVAGGGLIAVLLSLYLGFGLFRAAPWDPAWLGALAEAPISAAGVLVISVWLWRWGLVSGRQTLTYDTYSLNFALGVLAFAIALYFSLNTAVVPPGSLVPPLLLFFAIGLALLALASLQSARQFERMETDQHLPLNRYWFGTVGAAVGVILLTGLVLGQLFEPRVAASIVGILAFLYDLLTRLLLVIALVLAYLVLGPLQFLADRFHLQPTGNQAPLQAPPSAAELFRDVNQKPPPGISPELYLVLQVATALLVVVAILAIFGLAFRRFRVLGQLDVAEEHESILSADLLKEQLAQLFRRRSGTRAARQEPFVSLTGEDPRVRIRRIYQALLAWAGAHGVPRSPGLTPNEYLMLMNRALHIYIEPIAIITDAYLDARYGSEPIPPARAEEAARAWEQIAREDGKQ